MGQGFQNHHLHMRRKIYPGNRTKIHNIQVDVILMCLIYTTSETQLYKVLMLYIMAIAPKQSYKEGDRHLGKMFVTLK